ncbi:hypothetical protein PV396_09620 [Streptomyces sp. ME02-8801-2C]|uniref:hypothetical protein n=1 Tax=Streptomyces sp. ME02-8801-2C TaxID=3028680 RepID=UPI0029B3203B|nr:hypothetical protein [Streptomyces sp. ME02-8801-2C]MDX3452193.1 hypothetical protein [Streptomyces sp. ME02-8801-2C]
MLSKKSLWTMGAGLAAAAVVVRRSQTQPLVPADERWLKVTVNREPGDMPADKLPSPLQDYGDRIETRVSAAPGDRGTELAVRLREPLPDVMGSVPARLAGLDPRQDLRRALRDAKALLEGGEVLEPDEPTTHDTPGGRLVGVLTRRARGEGVL